MRACRALQGQGGGRSGSMMVSYLVLFASKKEKPFSLIKHDKRNLSLL